MTETTPQESPLRIRKKEPAGPIPYRSKWRGFFQGLLIGQVLIIALNFGFPLLLRYLKDQIAVSPGMPLGVLIFMGMLGGILLTAVIVALMLLVSAVRGGNFWSGCARLFKAGAAIGFTAAVLGGTALVMIPMGQWSSIPRQVKEITVGLWEKMK